VGKSVDNHDPSCARLGNLLTGFFESGTGARLSRPKTRLRLSPVRESVGPRFRPRPACRHERGNASSRAAAALPRAGRPASMASGVASHIAAAAVIEAEGQVVLNEACLPVQGSRHGAGFGRRHVRPRRCRATLSGGVVLWPEVGREKTGPSLGVGSRSEGVSCEGSGAGRDVKVRPGAPSAGTSRRFFVQEPNRLRRRRERCLAAARMRRMATSARTRRLLLYHGRVAPLNQIL
jgi:hypothetical protein